MDNRSQTSSKWHRLYLGAVVIAALCAQYTTLLIATPSEMTQAPTGTSSERANWNDEETTALVDYLYEHQSEAGDGGNFKQSTSNAAAVHIAPLLTLGTKKSGNMCKTKWESVSNFRTLCCLDSNTHFLDSKHISWNWYTLWAIRPLLGQRSWQCQHWRCTHRICLGQLYKRKGSLCCPYFHSDLIESFSL